MKNVIYAIAAIAMLSCAQTTVAQEKKEEKKKRSVSISKEGVKIKSNDSSKTIINKTDDENESHNGKDKPKFKSNYMMLDLGLNLMQDNTNYADPTVQALLNVPANRQNESLFNQRASKSINVNIYPWMLKFAALRTKNQRIYISTGIGLQLYNFRYDEQLVFNKNPMSISLDTIQALKKNKLAMNYLSVPLMLTFKSRLYNDHWLAYGVGITGGYRIAAWTKQVTTKGAKSKSYDAFGTSDFITSVNAEIGIDGAIRFYASYQLTSMFDNGLDQHPICFGIRFNGI